MTKTWLFLFLIALTAPTAHGAASSVTGGYQEAVFSVSSITWYRNFLANFGGWEELHQSAVSDEQLAAWGLPETASARQLVMKNPGTRRGYIRLVQFSGVEQQIIRSNAQSWDTGGWFDVNARVLSMAQKSQQFQARGWQGYSDPVEFSFGPFVVKEWLTRGPDGVVLALIERVKPALEGWPQLTQISRIFNATQIVSDMTEARAFYEDGLGFKPYLEHHGASQSAGPNVLGLPHNLATEIPRTVAILHPDGVNEGSVELLKFEGAEGADWSALAQPPNLGIVLLRFPVADMAAFTRRVAEKNLSVAFPARRLDLPPYGPVHLLGLRGPDGVWLEFFETVSEEEAE